MQQAQAVISMILALVAALMTIVAITIVGDGASLALSSAAASALFILLLSMAWRMRVSLSPHNVALIGYPRSGKTILLVTMFRELMLRKVSNVSGNPRGIKTIDRVTKYMEKIKRRQAVGSTTRGSQFPYEANITRRGFLGGSFKVSFGDFPGERSEEYINELVHKGDYTHPAGGRESLEEDSVALFDGEFFRWVLECDALIFVIDVAQYLKDKAGPQDYAVKASHEYIRTWSYILDARREGGAVKEPIVVLLFTKCDLFDVDAEESEGESLEAKIAILGFDEPLPEVREISRARFEDGSRRCEEDFRDLTDFLKRNSRTFHVVCTSSFALMDGQMLGVERLFRAVVPRR